MPLRDLRMHMHDIIEACASIEQVVAGRTIDDYRSDRHFGSGIEREFILIGEALRRAIALDATVEDIVSESRRIIGFRNNLVHQYEVIDDAVVWSIVQNNVTVLRHEAEQVMKTQ